MLIIGKIVRYRERLNGNLYNFAANLKFSLKKKHIKKKSGNQLLNPERIMQKLTI